jgi:DNA topoisomerase-1
VLDAYLNGAQLGAAKRKLDQEIAEHAHALREEERALIDLLQQRAALEQAG